jgi:hemerythrin-like domain-containing protein
MNHSVDDPLVDSNRSVDKKGFAGLTVPFHRLLAQLLTMHQEALLIDDRVLALNVFELFVEALQRHLDVENNLLLPLHRSLVQEYRWSPMVYEKEHDKLLQMAARIRRELAGLVALEGRPRRLAVLELLDYQRSFKSVMEHHEEREEQALLPELDAWPDSEIFQQAYAQVSLVWQRYMKDIEPQKAALEQYLG